VTNAPLLNVTLPTGTSVTTLLFFLDGSNAAVAADLIVATRP
jgi:hypothetical protein